MQGLIEPVPLDVACPEPPGELSGNAPDLWLADIAVLNAHIRRCRDHYEALQADYNTVAKRLRVGL